MENQNNQINNIGKLKSKFWKFTLMFFAVIIGIFVLYIGGLWTWQKYRYWQDMETARKAEEGIKKWQQEDYEVAMADTYGGKTPQETLQMYIEAVEKGDYELASKYFIGDMQERELESFDGATEEFLKEYVDILKNTLVKLDVDGKYDIEKKYFSIYKPIGIRMKLYPNNIWKIIEI